jgi:hypothetical protein
MGTDRSTACAGMPVVMADGDAVRVNDDVVVADGSLGLEGRSRVTAAWAALMAD